MTRDTYLPGALKTAFLVNFIWINLSEVARYFLVVRPMLHEALAAQQGVAPMSVGIFALWGIWDLVLIVSATGFYWLWLDRFGDSLRQIVLASAVFTVTIFGLIWLGIANMGLAPYSLIVAALPLAWIEQAIACWLVVWARSRAQPASSMRSM
ncbi:hypothetical protein [uncultured Erythrobacter sp.]|uniref:hypothetical protein n=1 Tax=uncultured Erythrobacter sp. TaxID=263913 RepID=UPI00261165F1|nr:hypothetical protein [uncultured Erythrobacter sp.]